MRFVYGLRMQKPSVATGGRDSAFPETQAVLVLAPGYFSCLCSRLVCQLFVSVWSRAFEESRVPSAGP